MMMNCCKFSILLLYWLTSSAIQCMRLGNNILIIPSPSGSQASGQPSLPQSSSSSAASNGIIIIDAASKKKKDKTHLIILESATKSVSAPMPKPMTEQMPRFIPDFDPPLPLPAPYVDSFDYNDILHPRHSQPLSRNFLPYPMEFEDKRVSASSEDKKLLGSEAAESEEDEDVISYEEEDEPDKDVSGEQKRANNSSSYSNQGNSNPNSYPGVSNGGTGNANSYPANGNKNTNQLPTITTAKPIGFESGGNKGANTYVNNNNNGNSAGSYGSNNSNNLGSSGLNTNNNAGSYVGNNNNIGNNGASYGPTNNNNVNTGGNSYGVTGSNTGGGTAAVMNSYNGGSNNAQVSVEPAGNSVNNAINNNGYGGDNKKPDSGGEGYSKGSGDDEVNVYSMLMMKMMENMMEGFNGENDAGGDMPSTLYPGSGDSNGGGNTNSYGSNSGMNTNSYGGNSGMNTNSYGGNSGMNTNSYGGNSEMNTNSYGGNSEMNTNSYGSNNGGQQSYGQQSPPSTNPASSYPTSSGNSSGKKKKKTGSSPCAVNEANQVLMMQMMQMMLKMKFKEESRKDADQMKSLWTNILSNMDSQPACKSCPPCSLMTGGPLNGHYGEVMKSSTPIIRSNTPSVVYELEKYPPSRLDMISLPFAPGKFLPPHPVMMASTDVLSQPEEDALATIPVSVPNKKDYKGFFGKKPKKKTILKSSLEPSQDTSRELIMKSNVPREFHSRDKLQTYSDSLKIEVIETAESTARKGVLEVTELKTDSTG